MGTMVEFYANNAKDARDYFIGEKIYKAARGYLRRLDNPHADGRSYNCYPGLGAFESEPPRTTRTSPPGSATTSSTCSPRAPARR